MDPVNLTLEVLRGFVLPIFVSIVTAVITLFVFERFKSAETYSTLLQNLKREMSLAERAHAINDPAAKHLTGAFISYPIQTVEYLLFDPVYSRQMPDPLITTLQNYLEEALRVNSLIENAKLLIGAGQDLGSRGTPGVITESLRDAIYQKSIIHDLIKQVQNTIPR